MDVNRRGRSDIYWNRIRRLGGGFYSRKWRFKLRQTLLRRSNFTDQKLWVVCIPPIPNYGFLFTPTRNKLFSPFLHFPSRSEHRWWDKYINGIDMTLMFDYKPGLFDCKSESNQTTFNLMFSPMHAIFYFVQC